MGSISASVTVPWSKEPIPKSLIARSASRNRQEVLRVKGKLPLVDKDEQSLFTVLGNLGATGVGVSIQDVSAIKTGRLIVEIKTHPVSANSHSDKSIGGHLSILFKRKGWHGFKKNKFSAPTTIPFLVGLPQPSQQFERLFGLKGIQHTYSSSRYLLGAYEKSVFGSALRRGELKVNKGNIPKNLADFLLAKSDARLKKAIDSPDIKEAESYIAAGLSALFKANNSVEDGVAGLQGIGRTLGEVTDVVSFLEKSTLEYAEHLANDIKGRKFSVYEAIERARIVGAEVLGRNGRYIQGIRKGFVSALGGTIEVFEKNLRSTFKHYEDSLEGEGFTNPKNSRKRGRRKRQRIWNDMLEEQFPQITKAAANATNREMREVVDQLEVFGKAAEKLGRAVIIIEIGEALVQERWEDTFRILLTTVFQEIGSIILSVVGRYMGAVLLGAIGALLGPIGFAVGISVGYFAGAFVGGYYGSVFGEKVAESLSPTLIKALSDGFQEIEIEIEAIAEQYDLGGIYFTERDIRLNDEGNIGDSYKTKFEQLLESFQGPRPSDKR